MSIRYTATVKSARLGSVITYLGSTGYLNILSGTGALLAALPLASPAGVVSTSGSGTSAVVTLNFSGLPLSESSALASGQASAASLSTAAPSSGAVGGTVIADNLVVGTVSGDIQLSSLNIVAGQPVTITAASIQHA